MRIRSYTWKTTPGKDSRLCDEYEWTLIKQTDVAKNFLTVSYLPPKSAGDLKEPQSTLELKLKADSPVLTVFNISSTAQFSLTSRENGCTRLR